MAVSNLLPRLSIESLAMKSGIFFSFQNAFLGYGSTNHSIKFYITHTKRTKTMQKPLFESSQDLANKYFIGSVVKTNDDKQKNRVKVKIEGMNDTINTEALPWYAIMSSAGGSNNSNVAIPTINSRVLVIFPDGDIYNGLVSFVLPQDIAS